MDAVIVPAETRKRLIDALEILCTKVKVCHQKSMAIYRSKNKERKKMKDNKEIAAVEL